MANTENYPNCPLPDTNAEQAVDLEDLRHSAAGKERYSTVFYGGWYVLDNTTGECWEKSGRHTAIRDASRLNQHG